MLPFISRLQRPKDRSNLRAPRAGFAGTARQLLFESLETREVLSSSTLASYIAPPDSSAASPQAQELANQLASLVQAELHGALLQQASQALPIQIDQARLSGGQLELRGSIAGEMFTTSTPISGLFTPTESEGVCGILNLELGPIHLDVLGLNLDTSEICLNITAQEGSGNLLGNLLCDVAGLLDQPISLEDLLASNLVPPGQLVAGIEEVIGQALSELIAAPASVAAGTGEAAAGECPILDLSLGPVHLDLLGLVVDLDNCAGGPVTISLTAVEGPGNLLGNLLCAVTGLLDENPGLPNLGSLLDITNVFVFGNNGVSIEGNFAGEAFRTATTLTGIFQPPAAGQECGILSLQLGEIHLDLLGLKVDTSEICLDITGVEGSGNLLGNLICDITGALDGPISLHDLLRGPAGELRDAAQQLVGQLDELLSEAFENIFSLGTASLGNALASNAPDSAEICPILDLSLGPIDLDLLGLNVHLDDCDNGPVLLSVSAEEGPGNLLGNLLCAVSGLLDDLGDVDLGGALPIEIDRVRIQGGNLLIRGTIGGERFDISTAISGTFTPVELGTGPAIAQSVCGILKLELAPIHLDVLGLNLDTSAICLNITGEEGSGNLLGNLLCDVAGLLDGPISLDELLSGGLLPIGQLTNALESLVQSALTQLLSQTPVVSLPTGDPEEGVCPILDLSLGPVNLDVLGLNVDLDNCEDGPVTVALSAVEGPGNLLGNLLCAVTGVLDNGVIDSDDAAGLLDISDITLLPGNFARLVGTFAGQAFDTVLGLAATLLPPADGEECGVLSLELGEIHLDLLGLNVDTSEICLDVTGVPGPGNLLGNLICDITGLLDGPISLGELLNSATGELRDLLNDLLDNLGGLLSDAFENLFTLGSVTGPLGSVGALQEGVCPILDLSLGPIDLNLLGLVVHLDDCNDGPVTVSVSAEEGPGNLVGNLLCSIVGLLDDAPTPTPPTEAHIVAAGIGAGEEPLVKVFDAETGEELLNFLAYDSTFRGGVNVAVGDVNNDGRPDVITGAGAGGGPHVRVFDITTGELITGGIREFFAYSAGFTGGVSVASGDLNGDGFDDIVTGAGAGGGPHVRVFSGANGAILGEFFAYAASFMGGVNVAVGDIDGDGQLDIVTGAGAGGGPHVRVFNLNGSELAELPGGLFAYSASFTGGVFVATGDVDGDEDDEIITGAGASGGPHVRVFDLDRSIIREFFAFNASFDGGVGVATSDFDDDGLADVIAIAGAGIESLVRIFDGLTGRQLDEIVPFDGSTAGGSVAASLSAAQQTAASSSSTLSSDLIRAAALSSFESERSSPAGVHTSLAAEAVDATLSADIS